jgi:hypothetical protein
LGVPVVPDVSGDQGFDGRSRWAGDLRCRFIRPAVHPGEDSAGVRPVGEGLVDRVGELLVVDDGVGVLAVDHVGQRRPGERGVEQQHVGTDAGGRDQRFDEAAMVAAHDADCLGCAAGQLL